MNEKKTKIVIKRERLDNNIKYFREKRKLTSEELAIKAGMKKGQQINDYQSGRYAPNIYTAIRIADALGVKDVRVIFPTDKSLIK